MCTCCGIFIRLKLLRRERWCVSQGPQTVCARVKYCADGTASYEPMCRWHKKLIVGSEKIKTPSVARCFFFIKERKERKRKKGEERKEKKEKKRRERRKEKERPTKKREVCIAISC